MGNRVAAPRRRRRRRAKHGLPQNACALQLAVPHAALPNGSRCLRSSQRHGSSLRAQSSGGWQLETNEGALWKDASCSNTEADLTLGHGGGWRQHSSGSEAAELASPSQRRLCHSIACNVTRCLLLYHCAGAVKGRSAHCRCRRRAAASAPPRLVPKLTAQLPRPTCSRVNRLITSWSGPGSLGLANLLRLRRPPVLIPCASGFIAD